MFLSLLAKPALAYLPTALSVASRPLFSFSADQVCSSFSAEACAILQALCWSRQHQQVYRFSYLLLLSDSRSVLATPFSPSSFLLPQSLSENVFSLLQSYQLSGLQFYNGSPDTRFFQTTTRLMNWPDREGYLFPQKSLVVTLLLSLVYTFLFSRIGGVLSHLNSLTHRFPRFPPRNLCFHVMLALFSLTFAATDTQPSVKLLISLGLVESKILRVVLANTCIRTPLISFCTVQLRTLCVARSLTIFCLSTTSVPGPGEFPGF